MKSNSKLEVLFGHLQKDAMVDVINAFYAKTFENDADIIQQGASGDCLYIVADGSVDIFVARPPTEPGDKGGKVATFTAGALFGELALMYEAPRAATVTAAGPVSTWVLDAVDFKMLLQSSANATLQKYEGWLSQVPLLQSLNHFELSQLSDIMQSDCFDAGEEIIAQGDEGDKFFILEDGTAAAFIHGQDGEKNVMQYSSQGSYFGEIALLTKEPRRATVRATDEGCIVAYVSQEDFTSVLGHITDKLLEDISKYPQYSKFVTG